MDLNATQAAIRCGYSPKTAKQQGSRLLTNAAIAAALQRAQTKQLTSTDLSATRVLQELGRLALVDLRGFFDERGALKPIHTLDADQGACLAGLEVVKKNLAAGDNHIDTIHKIKVWDKPKALDILAKHFGLLKESLDLTGNVTVTWQAPT